MHHYVVPPHHSGNVSDTPSINAWRDPRCKGANVNLVTLAIWIVKRNNIISVHPLASLVARTKTTIMQEGLHDTIRSTAFSLVEVSQPQCKGQVPRQPHRDHDHR